MGAGGGEHATRSSVDRERNRHTHPHDGTNSSHAALRFDGSACNKSRNVILAMSSRTSLGQWVPVKTVRSSDDIAVKE